MLLPKEFNLEEFNCKNLLAAERVTEDPNKKKAIQCFRTRSSQAKVSCASLTLFNKSGVLGFGDKERTKALTMGVSCGYKEQCPQPWLPSMESSSKP